MSANGYPSQKMPVIGAYLGSPHWLASTSYRVFCPFFVIETDIKCQQWDRSPRKLANRNARMHVWTRVSTKPYAQLCASNPDNGEKAVMWKTRALSA